MAKRQRQIRMDPDFEKRIRKYQERIAKQQGIDVTFSDAARMLIHKALEAEGIR